MCAWILWNSCWPSWTPGTFTQRTNGPNKEAFIQLCSPMGCSLEKGIKERQCQVTTTVFVKDTRDFFNTQLSTVGLPASYQLHVTSYRIFHTMQKLQTPLAIYHCKKIMKMARPTKCFSVFVQFSTWHTFTPSPQKTLKPRKSGAHQP